MESFCAVEEGGGVRISRCYDAGDHVVYLCTPTSSTTHPARLCPLGRSSCLAVSPVGTSPTYPSPLPPGYLNTLHCSFLQRAAPRWSL